MTLQKSHLMEKASTGRARTRSRRDIAATIAWLTGANLTEARTTESIYLHYPNGAEVRFSCHSKFGRLRAADVLVTHQSLDRLIEKFRVAVLAARHDLTTHAQVYKRFGYSKNDLAREAGF